VSDISQAAISGSRDENEKFLSSHFHLYKNNAKDFSSKKCLGNLSENSTAYICIYISICILTYAKKPYPTRKQEFVIKDCEFLISGVSWR